MPLTTSMGEPIMQKVLNYLKKDDWNFQRIEGKPALGMSISGENGSYALVILANEENRHLIVYSVSDTKVSYSKRKAVSEYLTRANYGLSIGNFEFDLDDGEFRYKTSINVGNSVECLSNNMIRNLMVNNIWTMDRYFPGIMQINNSDEEVDIKELVWGLER